MSLSIRAAVLAKDVLDALSCTEVEKNDGFSCSGIAKKGLARAKEFHGTSFVPDPRAFCKPCRARFHAQELALLLNDLQPETPPKTTKKKVRR